MTRLSASPEPVICKRRHSTSSTPSASPSGVGARRKVPRLRDSRPGAPAISSPSLPTKPRVVEYIPQLSLGPLLQTAPPLPVRPWLDNEDDAPRELDIRIDPLHLTTANPAVVTRQLWGDGEYTDDSDVVAILAHGGHYLLTNQPVNPPRFDHLVAKIRAVPHASGMRPFESTEANGIRSRYWGTVYDGFRISVECIIAVKADTETALAKPLLVGLRPHIPHLRRWGETDSSPAADIALSFDLLNEPCLCFTITAVADKGMDPRLSPSRRLVHEVIYLEHAATRFELALVREDPKAVSVPPDSVERRDTTDRPVRFSKLKPETIRKLRAAKLTSFRSVRKSRRMKTLGLLQAPRKDSDPDCVATATTVSPDRVKEPSNSDVLRIPLPIDAVDVIATVKWSDLYWGTHGVTVNGQYYEISKLVFAPIKSDNAIQASN